MLDERFLHSIEILQVFSVVCAAVKPEQYLDQHSFFSSGRQQTRVLHDIPASS